MGLVFVTKFVCYVLLQVLLTFVYGLTIKERELLKELEGSHIRITAYPLPPFSVLEKNGTQHTELQKTVRDFVSKTLNVTCSFVNVHEDDLEKYGIKEASMLLVQRGEAEMSMFAMALTPDHCSRIDCSVLVTVSNMGLLVPWPNEESRLLAPIRPFQLNVWLTLFTVLIVVSVVLVWVPGIHRIVSTGNNEGNTNQSPTSSDPPDQSTYPAWSRSLMYLLGIMTNQGNEIEVKHLSFRLVVAAWVLSACVLVNAYAGTLISYMTVPKFQPVPRSLKDLATDGQPLKLMTEYQSAFANDLLTAPSGPLKVLGDSLRRYPDSMFTSRLRGLELLNTGRYAYVAAQQFAYTLLKTANGRAGYCRFTISSNRVGAYGQFLVFGFPHKWRYTKAANEKLLSWWDVGLSTHFVESVVREAERCMIDNYSSASVKNAKISLRDLSSAFVILLLGISLSILVFLIERIYANFRRNPLTS